MKTEQGLQIAEILFDKSYCDVSEYKNRFEVADKVLTETREKLTKAEHDRDRYKAEIEQLKAKNKVLGDGVAKAFTNGFNTGREQVEKDIRRAKIDVLKELQEKYVMFGVTCAGWISFVPNDDIDEMIEELKE